MDYCLCVGLLSDRADPPATDVTAAMKHAWMSPVQYLPFYNPESRKQNKTIFLPRLQSESRHFEYILKCLCVIKTMTLRKSVRRIT